MRVTLYHLPSERIEDIAMYLDKTDLASFASIARRYNEICTPILFEGILLVRACRWEWWHAVHLLWTLHDGFKEARQRQLTSVVLRIDAALAALLAHKADGHRYFAKVHALVKELVPYQRLTYVADLAALEALGANDLDGAEDPFFLDAVKKAERVELSSGARTEAEIVRHCETMVRLLASCRSSTNVDVTLNFEAVPGSLLATRQKAQLIFQTMATALPAVASRFRSIAFVGEASQLCSSIVQAGPSSKIEQGGSMQ